MKSQDVRPIVCGTDFSRTAEQAANVAADLAARLGTTLLLVHGVDERGEFPQVYGPRFAEARPHLDKEEARLRRLGADVRGDVTIGVLDGGVARFAERADARLIVVGASGTGMLKRMIGTGSVAERIAETAWVPTLVVQDAAPFSSWFGRERALQIFVGADFSPVSEAVLRFVRELSEVEACKITVGFVDLHATERGEQALHLSPNAPPAPEMQQMLTHDLREKTWTILGKHDVHVHVLPAPGRVDQRLLELASEAGARSHHRRRNSSMARAEPSAASLRFTTHPSHGENECAVRTGSHCLTRNSRAASKNAPRSDRYRSFDAWRLCRPVCLVNGGARRRRAPDDGGEAARTT